MPGGRRGCRPPYNRGAARGLLLLQICDPTFPIGAYANSFGLETYAQPGLVHDGGTAREHMVSAAYGVFAALAGIDEEELLRRYLYGQVSAMVTNCVKTVPLSQTVGQALLFSSARAQVEAVERALAADESLLGLSTPASTRAPSSTRPSAPAST